MANRPNMVSSKAPFQVEDAACLTDHLVIGADDVDVAGLTEKIRKEALAAGHVLVYPDRRVWRGRRAQINAGGEGSDAYVWDAAGNRVRCDVIEFTQDTETQEITERVLRRVWVRFEEAV